MKTSFIVAALSTSLLAASPAFAQFTSSSGTTSGGPNISGAGTGLSAPSAIGSGSPGMSNPNAIAAPSTAPAVAPVQPIYPGVGIGGAGLPPAAVLPQTARQAAHASTGNSGTPH